LFYLSFSKTPSKVCKVIRRIQIQFLWDWGHDARKIAWIAWDKVCSPKEMGGLGVRDISKFIEVLIAKWKWRFGVEKKGVWKDLLESRYDTWRDMKSDRENLKQSSWWKDLCKICDVRNQINWFDNNINWILRDGKLIQVLEDRWIGR